MQPFACMSQVETEPGGGRTRVSPAKVDFNHQSKAGAKTIWGFPSSRIKQMICLEFASRLLMMVALMTVSVAQLLKIV
jgi:hypothetical protein